MWCGGLAASALDSAKRGQEASPGLVIYVVFVDKTPLDYLSLLLVKSVNGYKQPFRERIAALKGIPMEFRNKKVNQRRGAY